MELNEIDHCCLAPIQAPRTAVGSSGRGPIYIKSFLHRLVWHAWLGPDHWLKHRARCLVKHGNCCRIFRGKFASKSMDSTVFVKRKRLVKGQFLHTKCCLLRLHNPRVISLIIQATSEACDWSIRPPDTEELLDATFAVLHPESKHVRS
jgi:hypothetical protein